MILKKIPERIRTVLIYAPIPIALLFINAWAQFSIIGIVLILALSEWRQIVMGDEEGTVAALAWGIPALGILALSQSWPYYALGLGALLAAVAFVRAPRSRIDLAIGVVFPLSAAIAVLALVGHGLEYLFFVIVIAATSDSAAYFVGRAIGKTPFAPTISPKKTWEGAIGGWLAAVIFGVIFAHFFVPLFANLSLMLQIVIYLVLAFLGQLGDLSESALKRKYGVKDSGTILPGHGGVLDRFDALAFIALGTMIALWIAG